MVYLRVELQLFIITLWEFSCQLEEFLILYFVPVFNVRSFDAVVHTHRRVLQRRLVNSPTYLTQASAVFLSFEVWINWQRTLVESVCILAFFNASFRFIHISLDRVIFVFFHEQVSFCWFNCLFFLIAAKRSLCRFSVFMIYCLIFCLKNRCSCILHGLTPVKALSQRTVVIVIHLWPIQLILDLSLSHHSLLTDLFFAEFRKFKVANFWLSMFATNRGWPLDRVGKGMGNIPMLPKALEGIAHQHFIN